MGCAQQEGDARFYRTRQPQNSPFYQLVERLDFGFNRRLLGDLCRAAARTVVTVYRAASGRPDAVPGMVDAIQTFG